MPVSLSPVVSIEGTDNFQEKCTCSGRGDVTAIRPTDRWLRHADVGPQHRGVSRD